MSSLNAASRVSHIACRQVKGMECEERIRRGHWRDSPAFRAHQRSALPPSYRVDRVPDVGSEHDAAAGSGVDGGLFSELD